MWVARVNEHTGGRGSALGGSSAGLHCNAKAESGSQDTHLKDKRWRETERAEITTHQTGSNSPSIRPHPERENNMFKELLWQQLFAEAFNKLCSNCPKSVSINKGKSFTYFCSDTNNTNNLCSYSIYCYEYYYGLWYYCELCGVFFFFIPNWLSLYGQKQLKHSYIFSYVFCRRKSKFD